MGRARSTITCSCSIGLSLTEHETISNSVSQTHRELWLSDSNGINVWRRLDTLSDIRSVVVRTILSDLTSNIKQFCMPNGTTGDEVARVIRIVPLYRVVP